MNPLRGLLLAATLVVAPVVSAGADGVRVGLGGSRASVRRQHEVAKKQELTFLRTAAQVRTFADKDRLERLTGNADYTMGRVSFPYARPAVKLFIERLAAQYREATGEQLVVTSLTRPTTMQPRNASPLSVHPAGIAVDLRIPKSASARRWLESALLSLERKGVLDATRERRPPHYHVAVFPEQYESYVATLAGGTETKASMMVAGLPTMESALAAIPVPAPLETATLASNESGIPLASIGISLAVIALFGVAGTVRRRSRTL